jgi:hypothetical protein
MFRIIDRSGYEYRTNAAGKEVLRDRGRVGPEQEIEVQGGFRSWDMLINFELADGNNLSDLVGITFWQSSHARVEASPLVGSNFGPIEIYRENETMNSCPVTTFACGIGFLDKAVDRSLPNSKGQDNEICTTTRLPDNKAGWLHMPFAGFSCADPIGSPMHRCPRNIERNAFFVGFIGLNDDDGSGSMDSWWSQRPEDRRKQRDGKGDVCCADEVCNDDRPSCDI